MEALLENEAEIGKQIDALCLSDPAEAERFVMRLLSENEHRFSESRAVSGCLARLLCRFLLHRKRKDRLFDTIKNNSFLREAFFGRLNTYKYSLTFVLKRVMKHSDSELNTEIMKLIEKNPFRDDTAAVWSDRWSMDFILGEIARIPEDYLK